MSDYGAMALAVSLAATYFALGLMIAVSDYRQTREWRGVMIVVAIFGPMVGLTLVLAYLASP